MPNDVYQRYNESNHTKLISKFRCSSKMQETVKWLLTNVVFSLSHPLPLPFPFPLSIWNKNAIFVWKLKESCLNKCSIQKKWKRNRDETRRHETRWVSDIWNKRTQNNQHNKISSIDWMGMPRYRINWNVNIFRNRSREIVFFFIHFVLLKLLAIVAKKWDPENENENESCDLMHKLTKSLLNFFLCCCSSVRFSNWLNL